MLRLLALTLALSAAPVAAQEPCAAGRAGCYRDGDDFRNAAADYERMRAPRDQDRLRLAGEYVLFLTGGAVWYFIDDRNIADWDYESLQQRLTLDAFRYDNNTFAINFIYHPLSGAAFHAFARSNDLGMLESIGWGFLVSAGWEVVLEFKERISINDTLVTTGAGIPLGEFVYKLGLHLRDGPAWMKWVLAFPVAFHDAWDGVGSDEGPSRFYTRFRIAYDVGGARADGGDAFPVHGVGFDGVIASIPGYLREGRFERFFTEGDVVSLAFRVGIGEGSGLDVLSDVTLLGLHRQDIGAGAGGLHGEAITIGTSLAWLYRAEEHERWSDRISILGLPGLALDAHVLSGATALHLGLRGWATFSGVESHAFDAWESANPAQRSKSILERERYYYAWGLWARAHLELVLGPVTLGGLVSWATFDSDEGLDRTQEELTADVAAFDDALDLRAYARLGPLAGPLYFELALTRRTRTSRVERARAEHELVRAEALLGLQL